jgi:phospholipase C
VTDRFSSRSTTLTIGARTAKSLQLPLNRTRGWYDLTVTIKGNSDFEYRYAGHLENGEPSISDPGMGGLV